VEGAHWSPKSLRKKRLGGAPDSFGAPMSAHFCFHSCSHLLFLKLAPLILAHIQGSHLYVCHMS